MGARLATVDSSWEYERPLKNKAGETEIFFAHTEHATSAQSIDAEPSCVLKSKDGLHQGSTKDSAFMIGGVLLLAGLFFVARSFYDMRITNKTVREQPKAAAA